MMPTKDIDQSSLAGLIPRFSRAKILVVGDLMLDEFIWGKVSRISPEAPVPVVWVQSESVMPGGAANVANNIRALGGQVTVVGVVGEDRWGDGLLSELDKRQVDVGGVLKTNRPTTVKTRVIAHHQQVVRVDREQRESLPVGTIERLIKAMRERIEDADAVVIEDYGKGVITRQLLEVVIPMARKSQKILTVDPKQEHFDLYQRVTALTPNLVEAGEAVGRELESDTDVLRAGEEILQRLQCEGVLITLGEDGMWLFEQSGQRTLIPTVAQEVFDVAGAGDTVIATFTLALASGSTMEQAARIANHAAGIVVGKLGVAVATPQELRTRLTARASVMASRRAIHLPTAHTGRQRRVATASHPLPAPAATKGGPGSAPAVTKGGPGRARQP